MGGRTLDGATVTRSRVKMASGPFTFGQLAKAAGTNIEQARYCRDHGLLPPPQRVRGRSDNVAYRQEHVERLRFVRRALLAGFTVEDIARMVDDTALTTCGDISAVTARRLELLEQDGHADAARRASLVRLLASCDGRGGRKDCKILQALSEPDP